MKKIGYTCGVYDLFHVGHLNLFERCKEKCDYLIVGVCDDEYVRQVKRKEPVINQNDRARIVGALKCVDEVHIIDTETTIDKVLAIEKFPYNVLFAGDDWKGTERFNKTLESFKEKNLDVEVVFFPYTQGVSTSALRENLKDNK
ncbi:MAG: adenylyltransferase/cytidyltransferase family protein [Clostridia bacterium]|nr:adenylyltransferase/cytidyltransferase family protein [Clostridia bacterium]